MVIFLYLPPPHRTVPLSWFRGNRDLYFSDMFVDIPLLEMSFVYCIDADSPLLADSVCLYVTWSYVNSEATGSSANTEMSASVLSIIDSAGFVWDFYDDMMTVGLGLPREWFIDAFCQWVFQNILHGYYSSWQCSSLLILCNVIYQQPVVLVSCLKRIVHKISTMPFLSKLKII